MNIWFKVIALWIWPVLIKSFLPTSFLNLIFHVTILHKKTSITFQVFRLLENVLFTAPLYILIRFASLGNHTPKREQHVSTLQLWLTTFSALMTSSLAIILWNQLFWFLAFLPENSTTLGTCFPFSKVNHL